MAIELINPKTGQPLIRVGDHLRDASGNRFSIVNGVPRITEAPNYSESFGVQWARFAKTQLDRDAAGLQLSSRRFFAETRWPAESLAGQDILEVGSGAGRFSRVVLERTLGTLFSVDYSDAVTANYANNGQLAPDRFHLFQASIYDLPFPDNSFDKVFCFGVLQHTPDFAGSVAALIAKAKPGGEIVVDFYPINGWWTKVNAKYILRPVTKRLSHARLLRLIESNIDWLIKVQFFLHRCGLGIATRFLPVCNVKDSFPPTLTESEIREWAILDTFDQYSPEHDHPQRIRDVAQLFERCGADVTFSGVERFEGTTAAVVRGRKRATGRDGPR
jgi:SAM-dependent methyltransferase